MNQYRENEIRIRDAQDWDQPGIERLLLDAYGQYEQVMPADRWAEYRDSILESVYREGPEARIVAEKDGEIVGSLLLFLTSEAAYGRPELDIQAPIIRLLAASPKVRGQGVATRLIQATVERAKRYGAERIYLHSSDLMASAIRLYEYLGFERTPEKEMLNGTTLVKCYSLPLLQKTAEPRTAE
ncbi:GNAT family N-acetyltransferase [Paenibacillus pinistramenti]|uniref:GNAT family N-acetyltransferase n=1 Tax=Paenibacillus pinistramenti TaxID=1768003 RepID=UPI00110839E2|nr:GNAT family N-acetyltransferase [Paenibacillus pinistramenti]